MNFAKGIFAPLACFLVLCTSVLAFDRWSHGQWTVKSHVKLPSVCTNCQQPPKTVKPLQRLQNAAQRVCELKASLAARTRSKGHVGRNWGFGGGDFEGCGWSSAYKPNIRTCTPCSNRCNNCRYGAGDCTWGKLLGDAVVKGPDGWYRVRIWQRYRVKRK